MKKSASFPKSCAMQQGPWVACSLLVPIAWGWLWLLNEGQIETDEGQVARPWALNKGYCRRGDVPGGCPSSPPSPLLG